MASELRIFDREGFFQASFRHDLPFDKAGFIGYQNIFLSDSYAIHLDLEQGL